MKRQSVGAGAALKRRRLLGTRAAESGQPKAVDFHDATSSRQQAEKYRLVTARIPIDALSCSWKKGSNRRKSRYQIFKLCRIFRQGGLERQAEENFLLVQCSADAVNRMIRYLGKDASEPQLHGIFHFDAWSIVNGGEHVEVIAGQHRIEALREYVKKTGADPAELWWTCHFYNRDTLPPELDIKLRINRRDPSLPDSHGQIWMQLCSAACYCDFFSNGTKLSVEKQMLDVLQLQNGESFPVSRLVSLWRNDRWRHMATRWCETQLGRATFNISTWHWMASCRIDTYWFSTLDKVLDILHSLPGDSAYYFDLSDWVKLVAALPAGYSSTDVDNLFYTKNSCESASSPRKQWPTIQQRRTDLLIEMSDDDYSGLHRFILEHDGISFPDIRRLLKTTKEEGRIMMLVLIHVVAWLNPSPHVVLDRRESNKPLLREDFKPALQNLRNNNRSDRYQPLGFLEPLSADIDLEAAVELDSIRLERIILDTVRAEMQAFKAPGIRTSLDTLPVDCKDGYSERFVEVPWKKLFNIVQQALGSEVIPSWVLACPEIERLRSTSSETRSSLIREICTLVQQRPEFAQNPALNSPQAYELLSSSIDHAVAQWATQQCQQDCDNTAIMDVDGNASLLGRGKNALHERAGTNEEASLVPCDSPGHLPEASVNRDGPRAQDETTIANSKTIIHEDRVDHGTSRHQVTWPSFRSLFSMNEDWDNEG